MRKQVKLPPPKNQKTAKAQKKNKGEFIFFVKDQGEGAGRIAVIVLKVLELIVATIFAAVLGIFGPLCVWNADFIEAEVSSDPSAVWWLISSILYLIGLFFVMFGRSKIATVIHIAAAAGTLTTYSFYTALYEGYEGNGPTALYMPSLFILVLTVAIMLIINVPKWVQRKIERDNEQAPSILGDKK